MPLSRKERVMSFCFDLFTEIECSRAEARLRVFRTVFAVVLAIAAIALPAWFFPRAGSYEKPVSLSVGNNYELVDKVINGDVLVNELQFAELSQGNQVFVAESDKFRTTVSQYVKVDGVGYRYDHSYGHNFFYEVSDKKLVGRTLTLELGRDWFITTVLLIVVPAFALFAATVVFILATGRDAGNFRNQGPFY